MINNWTLFQLKSIWLILTWKVFVFDLKLIIIKENIFFFQKEKKCFILLNEKCSDMDQLKALFQIEIIEFAFSQNVQHAPALNVAKKALEKCMFVC